MKNTNIAHKKEKRSRGRPRKTEPFKEKMNLTFSPTIKQFVQRYAFKMGISVSEYFEQLAKADLKLT